MLNGLTHPRALRPQTFTLNLARHCVDVSFSAVVILAFSYPPQHNHPARICLFGLGLI